MSIIKNEKNPATDLAEVNRTQAEHRATWMALIYDEMVKAGVPNAEEIVRKAISRCGNFHGTNFHKSCKDPEDCRDLRDVFFTPLCQQTFNMTDVSADRDNLKATFQFCPLVEAWRKLGYDDERIDLLCDMAMDGDRGIANAMGLTLDLKDTIAKGGDGCILHFHK